LFLSEYDGSANVNFVFFPLTHLEGTAILESKDFFDKLRGVFRGQKPFLLSDVERKNCRRSPYRLRAGISLGKLLREDVRERKNISGAERVRRFLNIPEKGKGEMYGRKTKRSQRG
jgi:hypothetical protein